MHNHPPKCHNFDTKKNKNPSIRHRFLKQLHRWDARTTDQKLKVCPSCKLVWELVTIGKLRCEYYTDFPTYGKQRVLCEKCF